ncbi:MAG TPA: DUF3391 domain-containing protein, partial [Rhodocyclaceae bacterium]|nr:DUF3391 domain-containing protein [Rhodocyclaceae bacterium]
MAGGGDRRRYKGGKFIRLVESPEFQGQPHRGVGDRNEGDVMAGGNEGPKRIRIEQVCIGLHIKLDSWLGHPFLLSSFKIKNEQQIAALKSMGLT